MATPTAPMIPGVAYVHGFTTNQIPTSSVMSQQPPPIQSVPRITAAQGSVVIPGVASRGVPTGSASTATAALQQASPAHVSQALSGSPSSSSLPALLGNLQGSVCSIGSGQLSGAKSPSCSPAIMRPLSSTLLGAVGSPCGASTPSQPRSNPRKAYSRSSTGSTCASSAAGAPYFGWESPVDELQLLYEKIDADCNGSISQLELLDAVQRDEEIARQFLPGIDCTRLLRDEETFDRMGDIFEEMAGGKQRITYQDFVAYFQRVARGTTSPRSRARSTFDLVDTDGDGSLSKLELITAVQRHTKICEFILPGVDGHRVMDDERSFDLISKVFEKIAGGKKRISFQDFEEYFREPSTRQPRVTRKKTIERKLDRSQRRVFIIGPGFGQKLNPRQGAMLEQVGFQVKWYHNLPNPEQPTFPVGPYLSTIAAAIHEYQADVVAAASKGGVYLVGLWQAGYWTGPSLMINAHPTCTRLPEGVPIVIASGAQDEVYPRRRDELEQLISTGTEDMCYLYYSTNSGQLPTGQFSRVGDSHNMQSLLKHDCLPRLVDAALCLEGPAVHMARTWRDRLSVLRIEAEGWLGLSPERLRRLWDPTPSAQMGARTYLFDVPRRSIEFSQVEAIFKAAPAETPAYNGSSQVAWDRVQMRSIQRVQNRLQEHGSTQPYFEAMKRSFDDQGLELEPGVHTCWGFHGCEAKAIESITSNPVSGFQPLTSGSRGATLWGLGTYFARDAKYVADSHFCGPPAADGSRQMLMCLLMIGMPCLGDPRHNGVLPFRKPPHRYHSSVDDLSSPEIYIIQHPGAAHPAYVITFA